MKVTVNCQQIVAAITQVSGIIKPEVIPGVGLYAYGESLTVFATDRSGFCAVSIPAVVEEDTEADGGQIFVDTKLRSILHNIPAAEDVRLYTSKRSIFCQTKQIKAHLPFLSVDFPITYASMWERQEGYKAAAACYNILPREELLRLVNLSLAFPPLASDPTRTQWVALEHTATDFVGSVQPTEIGGVDRFEFTIKIDPDKLIHQPAKAIVSTERIKNILSVAGPEIGIWIGADVHIPVLFGGSHNDVHWWGMVAQYMLGTAAAPIQPVPVKEESFS